MPSCHELKLQSVWGDDDYILQEVVQEGNIMGAGVSFAWNGAILPRARGKNALFAEWCQLMKVFLHAQ